MSLISVQFKTVSVHLIYALIELYGSLRVICFSAKHVPYCSFELQAEVIHVC